MAAVPDARCVVVTGPSRGLGAATAIAFSRQGARLALLARNEVGLRRTASACSVPGVPPPLILSGDLTDRDHVEAAGKAILQSFPAVDVLVNNAAGWASGQLDALSARAVAETVASTLTAPLLLTRALLPGLRRSNRPCVINVASTAALPAAQPDASSTVFIAAKRGLAGFSDALRAELRPAGVRVTTIYPGGFDTDSHLDADQQRTLAQHGAGSMGVADVVEAILFCASRAPTVLVESLVITNFAPEP